MNIVLDANCLIQILPKKATYRWVFSALLDGAISLSVSNEIIAEYEEVLNVFYESKTLGGNVCRTILELPQTKMVEVYFNWQLITGDPDDNKYVDCAVASNADCIITNDAHFRVLQSVPFPKVVCLTLEQFEVAFARS